jgi:hypothetical protein
MRCSHTLGYNMLGVAMPARYRSADVCDDMCVDVCGPGSELAKSDTNILDRSAAVVEDKVALLGPGGGAHEVMHRLTDQSSSKQTLRCAAVAEWRSLWAEVEADEEAKASALRAKARPRPSPRISSV